VFGISDYLRRRKRAKLLAQPVPNELPRALERDVPYYPHLPPPLQGELQQKVRVFLNEKNFEGCGGFVMTDTVRVQVAAYACLLLLQRDTDFYPGLHAVLLYPEAFVPPMEFEDEHGLVSEMEEPEEGESWSVGTLLLSWEDMARDLETFNGRNVILHEFAHQLYDNGELTHGAAATRARWVEVFDRHYAAHERAVRRGAPTFIDEYGAEDPAEFFSVVTEQFFECPHEFREAHPELYGALRACYAQDPLSYFS